ncbi:hypothetical protein [Thermocrinis sp.]
MNLRKREVGLILLTFSFLLAYLFLSKYYELRDKYYRDYLKHKEIMFLMKNFAQTKREQPTESLIRELFLSHGVDFKSLRQVETGYEVRGANLRGEKLASLVYAIEEKGIKIIKLKAVDNTGEGIFEIYMLLK